MSPATTRQPELDQTCVEAVDLARHAAEEDAGSGQVGEHVGVSADAERVVTHLFASLNPAYVGWRWAVTVARAARAKAVTVSESMLVPGPDSLLAPPWVPWTERVRPGDLKAGDLMPARPDDERLIPVVAIAGEAGLLDWDESEDWQLGAAPDAAQDADGQDGVASQAAAPDAGAPEAVASEAVASEAGVSEAGVSEAGMREAGAPGAGAPDVVAPGRGSRGTGSGARKRSGRKSATARDRAEVVLRPARVLSAIGRDEAALRWYSGDHGPSSPLASSAPAPCLTCGFLVRLNGPLGRVFGVCANEFAPDDGKVVSVDHGCGAHSDGETAGYGVEGAIPAIDELGYDMLNTGSTVPDSVIEKLDHELA